MTEKNTQITSIQPNSHTPISLEDENVLLKKQLRMLEGESKKNQAILEQQIEILESQIADTKRREQNLTQMNETIMLALNEMNSGAKDAKMTKTIRELETATEKHQKEMQEFKTRTTDHINQLETENKSLRDRLAETEFLHQELQLKFEKANLENLQIYKDMQLEKSNLEELVKKYEDEKKQNKELYDYEMHLKMNELRNLNEKLKDEHRRELENVNAEYDKSLKDLKAIYESERKLLESRLEKTSNLLRKTQEESENKAIIVEMQNLHQAEMEQINKTLEETKHQHAEQVETLTNQRDEALDRAEKLDANLKKFKVQLKSNQTLQDQNNKILKEKLDKAKNVMEQGGGVLEENRRQKQKIAELKAQIKKLESSERRLKDMIIDKDVKIDEERSELKKLLNVDQKGYTKNPGLTSSKSQSQLSRSFLQHPSPTRQGEANYHNKSAILRIEQPKDDFELKNARETPTRFSANILDLSNILHMDDGSRPSATNYLSMNQSSHDGTRNHTPLKIQPQGRSDVLEGGEKQTLTAIDQPPQRNTVSHTEQLHTHNQSKGIENYSSLQIEKSNIIQPTSQPARNTVGEHLDGIETKQKHVRSRTEINKQLLYGNMTEYLEGAPTISIEPYNIGHSAVLNPKDAGVLSNKSNINYNERNKSPDPRFSQGTTENQPYTKATCSIKSSDELCDVRQYMEGEEENIDPPLLHSNGQYSNAYHSHSSSVEMSMQQAKLKGYHNQSNTSDPRVKIEDRLKLLEQKLSEMEVRNQGFRVEKDKTQTEFEKLLLELNQAKLDTSALGGEKKDDKEMALKNEIKFLINKLLQVKNKLEKQNEEAFASSQQSIQRRPSYENTSLLNVTANQNANNMSIISSLGGQFSTQLLNSSQRAPAQYLSYLNYNRDNRSPMGQRVQMEEQNAKFNKNSLGEAIENFSKNIRNRSTLKPQPQYTTSNHLPSNYGTLSKTTNRAKTPSLIRPNGGLLASKVQNTNTSMMNSSQAWNRRNL